MIKKTKKIPSNTIILACSGGVDSMVLLDLCVRKISEMSRKGKFETGNLDLSYDEIIVAHIHHGLRETAQRDEEIVKKYCKKNALKLELLRADIKKESQKTKTSIEECARNVRKDFLEKLRKKYQARCILTAHHADDQAETILYRIIKGTSITGLVGIEEETEDYVRPLLHVTKARIMKYALDNAIPYGHDETNDDTNIPRNLIRHMILPEMEKINPETRRALIRLGKNASELRDGFDSFFSDSDEAFSLDWYNSLPLGFQHECLRGLYERVNGSTHGLSRSFLEEIDRFLSTRNGGKKEFGKKWLVKKAGKISLES